MKKMKWLKSILMCFAMLFAFSVKADAADVTQKQLNEMYETYAFSNWVSNEAYFESGDAAPEGSVHWYLIMSGAIDQYYDEVTWNHEMTYDQYMEAVDSCFMNYTDMKTYLNKYGYYDESTGMVKFFAGGLGGAFTWQPTITRASGENTYKVSGIFINGEMGTTDDMREYFDYVLQDDWKWVIRDIEEISVVDTEEGLKIDAFVETDEYVLDDMYFTKGSDEVAYKLDLDLDENVTCSGTVAGGGATKETVAISRIDGNGYDYYLWPDSKTSLMFSPADGYSINEYTLSPESAGTMLYSLGNNIIGLSLTEPATLTVDADDKVIRKSDIDICLTANASEEGWFRGVKFNAERLSDIESMLLEELGEGYDARVYNMHLESMANGSEITFPNDVPMMMEVPILSEWNKDTITLYWYDEESTELDELEFNIGEDTVSVYMNSLKPFVLVTELSSSYGWQKDAVGWWYLNEDGSYPANKWALIDGEYYYFNAKGYRVENKWQGAYYLGEDGAMATDKWIGKYYVDATGKYQTGWLELEDGWYYLGADGAVRTGWFQVGSTWYYGQPDADGLLIENDWLVSGSTTYYFLDSCAMATGWQVIDGKDYYFVASGAMVTNAWAGSYWLGEDGIMAKNDWVDGGKSYVGADGKYKTGWLHMVTFLDDNWYYLGSNGVLRTGWFKVGAVWYFGEKETGAIYDNCWLAYQYYFLPGGAMATGWQLIDGDYYYFASSGEKVTNSWVGNYYLKENGVMAIDEWVDGDRYYVDQNGAWVPGARK